MKTFLLLSEKSWHLPLFQDLKHNSIYRWVLIDRKELFTENSISELNPDIIFIPHWSYIIPEDIFLKYTCIVFHMTDLPYGRGGSPLQNLIVNKHVVTKISAIKVDKGIDTGDVYLKKDLPLFGTAQEIFLRSVNIIKLMISEIINNNLAPVKQTGDVVSFKRRTADQGNLKDITDLETIYDYIRMLDAEGYPNAFLETESFILKFSRAAIKSDKEIIADVRIIKK